MRQSRIFTRTLKAVSAEESSVNAQLLLRGGFISRELAGVYDFLPYGLRVLNKINGIIRQEMDRIGGQEVHLSALQPSEAWEASGRWSEESMDVWFKTCLKSGTVLGLAPTHEEALTRLMKHYVSSYRDLPAFPYQFQTKFRNETRAKSGILRAREFLMKDLYSFCRDQKELDEFYEQAKEAYARIFQRLGLGELTYLTLASGGTYSKYSHEFQTLCESGEDLIYIHKTRPLAVNREIFNSKILDELGVKENEFESRKAIEVGNIFKLGTRFSEVLDLSYAGKNDERKAVVMGSYGIGPARVMGAIVETWHDENGIIWPAAVAPFSVHLISIGKSEAVRSASEKMYESLVAHDIEVLWDDRWDASPGVKFADADLIGCPYRVVAGERGIASGRFELLSRSGGERENVEPDKIAARLASIS